jgi:hypothetical protein
VTVYHVNQFDMSLLPVFHGVFEGCIALTTRRRSIYAIISEAHMNNEACHNNLPVTTDISLTAEIHTITAFLLHRLST